MNQTAISGLYFTEQRFEKCLRFRETAKQNNPYLLRVGALKIYCERKQTAKAVFFLRSSVSGKHCSLFNYFFLAHSLYLVLS